MPCSQHWHLILTCHTLDGCVSAALSYWRNGSCCINISMAGPADKEFVLRCCYGAWNKEGIWVEESREVLLLDRFFSLKNGWSLMQTAPSAYTYTASACGKLRQHSAAFSKATVSPQCCKCLRAVIKRICLIAVLDIPLLLGFLSLCDCYLTLCSSVVPLAEWGASREAGTSECQVTSHHQPCHRGRGETGLALSKLCMVCGGCSEHSVQSDVKSGSGSSIEVTVLPLLVWDSFILCDSLWLYYQWDWRQKNHFCLGMPVKSVSSFV